MLFILEGIIDKIIKPRSGRRVDNGEEDSFLTALVLNEKSIVSVDKRGTIKVWSTIDGSLLRTIHNFVDNYNEVCLPVLIDDGRLVWSDRKSDIIIIDIDADRGYTLQNRGIIVCLVALKVNKIASSSEKNKVYILSPKNLSYAFHKSNLLEVDSVDGYVQSMTGLDENKLAIGLSNGEIKIFNFDEGFEITTLGGMSKTSIKFLLALPDNKLCSHHAFGGKLSVWNVEKNELSYELDGTVACLFKDYKTLATGSLTSHDVESINITLWKMNEKEGKIEKIKSFGKISDCKGLLPLSDGRLVSLETNTIIIWK